MTESDKKCIIGYTRYSGLFLLLHRVISIKFSFRSYEVNDVSNALKNMSFLGPNDFKSNYEIALEILRSHFIKHKITYECLESTAKVINAMPGAIMKLPTTQYSLMKEFMTSNKLIDQYYVYCNKCQKYIKCSDGSAWTCANKRNNIECDQKLKLSAKNYFVYIRLEEQLKIVLERHWDTILAYRNQCENEDCENIRDTHSGSLIKNVSRENNNVLSLMLNSDGICLKKSGTTSVWPLQLICNFLPPGLRYKVANILCVGFWCQKGKVNMIKFCEPFAEEMERLQIHGIIFRNCVFRPAITSVSLDLPAKASFSQLIQFNGYCACVYCFQLGEIIENFKGVRYPWQNESSELRKHEDIVRVMKEVHDKKLKVKDGVKGLSPAIAFDHFDMVKSYAIDYMHCVCLGVVKKMPKFWFTANHGSYITPELRKKLNSRLTSIKPCSFITRLPRSLDDIGKFKASEFRSLLLYYFPVVLKNILKKKYYDHFMLLSEAIFILLKTNITRDDLIKAESNLIQFVKDFEDLYGKPSMTLNIHQLQHLVLCVKNLGPLWTQSMFSFESNNATFSRYVKGQSDVLLELKTKYMLHKSVPESAKAKPPTELACKLRLELTASEIAVLSDILFIEKGKLFDAYSAYVQGYERFTSVKYTLTTKRINYVVQLKNKIVGKIQFYFKHEGDSYLLLELYEVINEIVHIREIQPRKIFRVYRIEEIEKMLIYMHFTEKHYVTDRPNTFESD